jgi:hypothetical protein
MVGVVGVGVACAVSAAVAAAVAARRALVERHDLSVDDGGARQEVGGLDRHLLRLLLLLLLGHQVARHGVGGVALDVEAV